MPADQVAITAQLSSLFCEYHKLLAAFVAFKTVSTDVSFKPQIMSCVEWLTSLFTSHGFSAQTHQDGNKCNPIVFAQKQLDPTFPTVLIYGHYDVQPASIEDGWASDPFDLTAGTQEWNGKLLGRGCVDNKGQVLMHMVAIFDLLSRGELRKNVIFVIEGNEETGGGGLARLLVKRPDLFRCNNRCDVIIISDGEIPYSPVIEASFRGVANIELTLTTAKSALHSGIYGGAVPSASEEMTRLLNSLKDSSGRVLVPGFYDGDIAPNEEQLSHCKRLDGLRAKIIADAGVRKCAADFTARTGFSSMLEISGLRAGYTGEGFSNIVPHSATAKINLRLAGKTEPRKIVDAIISFLHARTPTFATLQVHIDELVPPVVIDIDSAVHQAAANLLRQVYGSDVAVNYCGATIPIVGEFARVLGVAALLIPLGNDDCNMHAANENLDIELAKKGLEFSLRYFSSI